MEVDTLELFIEDFFTVYSGQRPDFYALFFDPDNHSAIEAHLSNGNVVMWRKDRRTFKYMRVDTIVRDTFSCLDLERALDAYCRFFENGFYDTLDNCCVNKEGMVTFESFHYFTYYLWDKDSDTIEKR